METVTVTYNLYNFAELSEKAQKKALDNLRDIEIDGVYWDDSIIQDAMADLEDQGYMAPEIFYSGFGSQGDGASFKCTVDILAWLKAKKLLSSKEYRPLVIAIRKDLVRMGANIYTSGHYSHEMTMHIEHDCENTGIYPWSAFDKLETRAQHLVDAILEDARICARKIYKDLEETYNYLTSDEAVQEAIEANNFTFLENGTLKNRNRNEE